MKRFSLAMMLTLVVTGSLAAFQAEDWVKLEPIGGGFSVLMPSKPEEEVKTSDDFSMRLFTLTTPHVIYLASYGDYAPSFHIDVDTELAANRDSFALSLNATVIDSKKITVDGRPGLEFTAQNDTTFVTSRLYLFGNRIQQVSVAVPNGRRDNPDVDRFFASFAFTGVKPDGVKPDGVKPDGVKPDGVKPDGVKPDGVKPPGKP